MVVFKGFSPNEYFEWEDSHPLCSNALSPSGSVMITITITITTCFTGFYFVAHLMYLLPGFGANQIEKAVQLQFLVFFLPHL